MLLTYARTDSELYDVVAYNFLWTAPTPPYRSHGLAYLHAARSPPGRPSAHSASPASLPPGVMEAAAAATPPGMPAARPPRRPPRPPAPAAAKASPSWSPLSRAAFPPLHRPEREDKVGIPRPVGIREMAVEVCGVNPEIARDGVVAEQVVTEIAIKVGAVCLSSHPFSYFFRRMATTSTTSTNVSTPVNGLRVGLRTAP